MTIPTFAELIHTEQVEFPGFPDAQLPDTIANDRAEPRDHPAFPIGNDNQLLYSYDGALGGKTGYTDDARQTFVAGAERDGRRLAVTLLAADVLTDPAVGAGRAATRLRLCPRQGPVCWGPRVPRRDHRRYRHGPGLDRSRNACRSSAESPGPRCPRRRRRPRTHAHRIRARRVRRRLVARDRRGTTCASPLTRAEPSMPSSSARPSPPHLVGVSTR